MTEWPLNIARYTTGFVVGAALCFALVWGYIITFPMAFLPTGYPVWVAKKQMLDKCDLGAVMQFGDSQLEAGVVSNGLPLVSTNFSAGGVSPLDSYFLVRQALGCANHPKHAIISFGVYDYLQIEPAFWANTVRYGILGRSAVADMEDTARRLRDPSFDDYTTFDGYSGRERDLLYLSHFPPLYFNSLLSGGFFLREFSNRALLNEALARRGQMPYEGVQAPAPIDRYNKPPPPGFHPLPIQVDYFERMTDALESAGVSIDFIIMPISEANAPPLEAFNLERDFRSYLDGVQRRHPQFHLSQGTPPIWPDHYFVDGVHLNPEGARHFTALLNECLEMNDADWQRGSYSRSCEFAPPRQ